jgi:glycosyltransferase involved in cell wall biosynthesis
MTDREARPTVTVVIPCFNQARFLSGAVASVRGQRHHPVECIVVNDGSTDDTVSVARALGVHLIDQPNRGVSSARNAGLAAARSDYVVFLDADDELLPDAVAVGAAALDSDPALAAVFGRCQEMTADGHALESTVHNQVDPSRLYEDWLTRNFVWTPGAAIFRKQVLLETGGFPAWLNSAADYELYLRFARTQRVRFVANELVRYRRYETSMSRDPATMLRATLAVLHREGREAPPELRSRVAEGRRSWRDYYGDQIVDRLRADWRAGQLGMAHLQAVGTLVRHSPGVVLRHFVRKASRVVRALWRRAGLALRAAGRGRPERAAR